MKLSVLGMGLAALLAMGCSGEDGEKGEPGDVTGVEQSINGISPARSFPGRTVRLSISADNTAWDAAPTVSFDDAAIVVKNVELASATALFAEIEIGENAAIGGKTITVGEQTFSGFRVEAAAELRGEVLGTPAQGSVLLFDVKNLDAENLFDTSTDQDGYPLGLQPAELANGVFASASQVAAQSASFQLLIDANAAPGDVPLAVVGGDDTIYATSDKITIAARQPEPLVAGAVELGLFGSKLFSLDVPVTAGVGQIITLSSDSSASLFIDLGASGSWDSTSSFAAKNAWVKAGSSFKSDHLILLNQGEAATVNVALDTQTIEVAEVEPNNTRPQATALTDLSKSVYGDFTSGTDVDLFSVTLTEEKKISAATTALTTVTVQGFFGPTEVGADTLIRILRDDGTLVVASSDAGYNESIVTPAALPAGTYFIEVTHSEESDYDAQIKDYLLKVALQ